MTNRNFNLSGKDYFTIDEAAHYACVSNSQFRAKAAEYGLHAFPWMGRRLYRKVDIQAAMERVALLACGGPDTVPDRADFDRTGFALLAQANAAHQRRVARRRMREKSKVRD